MKTKSIFATTVLGLGIFTMSAVRPANAASYYVSNAGSDSNSGASPASAWKTMAKVSAWKFQPGDTIYLARGGMWRETLQPLSSGTSTEPITFTAYGTGALPIINGSDLVTGWTVSSGAIYSASLKSQPYNVYSDGLPNWGLAMASSVSAMTAGSWYWSGSTLYVWLTDGSNPANHQIEAADRVNGMYINGAASNNNGVTPIKYTFTAGTSGDGGTATANVNYITVNSIMTERTGNYGIQFYDSYAPLVSDCNLTQNGTGQQDLGYYNALHADLAPGAIYEDNTVSYGGGHNAIQMQRADGGLITGNVVTEWNHNGIDVKLSTNITVQGNTVHDSQMGSGLYTEYVGNYNAVQNIIYNTPMGIQSNLSTTAYIFNNSMLNTTGGGIYLGPAVGGTAQIENNITYGNVVMALENAGNYTLTTENYNDWGPATSSPTQVKTSGTAYNATTWITMTGHTNDISANPLWVNAPSDFYLQASSPCVNAGWWVGLGGKGSAPDMGAIESY
jgi:parallel beta-helix repeat protein